MDMSGASSSSSFKPANSSSPSTPAETKVDESNASSNSVNQAEARRNAAQEQRVSAADNSAETSSSPKAPVSSKDDLSNALARAASSKLMEQPSQEASGTPSSKEVARPVENQKAEPEVQEARDGGSKDVKADL
jgi:hypothetical protein